MKNYYKVYIVDLNSVGTHCGYGDGKTLREAQANALCYANHSYPNGNACLSSNGREVYIRGRICF